MLENEKAISIKATPTKRFFVEMLTRDIALEDAILDLLDNCVDGAMRSQKAKGGDIHDFSGYRADITFDRRSFAISDNCGGIPLDVAKDYAFRMGRPESATDNDNIPTVGAYGIGMKRALFRLGSRAEVLWCLKNGGGYRVKYDEQWFARDDDWSLSIEPARPDGVLESPGTRIAVQNLHQQIAEMLGTSNFPSGLIQRIGEVYSHILDKGFKVVCNGKLVAPHRLSILDAPALKGDRIEPYIYKDEIDGVKVLVVVGLTGPLTSDAESEKIHSRQRKTGKAGITVICNDRVVLYNDRTELTGWGDLAPAYHTQFISISGFARFSCDDALKLPLTTTKRGIDKDSAVYAQARLKIGEGLKIFTSYTNKWKKAVAEEHKHSHKAVALDVPGLVRKAEEQKVKVSKPQHLPQPPKSSSDMTTVIYKRSKGQIAKVSDFLYGNKHESAAKVGEASFDYCLGEAEENEEE